MAEERPILSKQGIFKSLFWGGSKRAHAILSHPVVGSVAQVELPCVSTSSGHIIQLLLVFFYEFWTQNLGPN